MDKALLIYRGREDLISADEFQSDYHGRLPGDATLKCPLCGRPVTPAAMDSSIVSRYFKHKRNDQLAKDCELYSSSYGFFSTYQRAPMPMFIRRSRSREGSFIVELGFRPLNDSLFASLLNEGARVLIGSQIYDVNEQNFPGGLKRYDARNLSLQCGSVVILERSSKTIRETWGMPEDANQAMVFTRDADSGQGKRIRNGDLIPFESNLYLLVPKQEEHFLRICVPRAVSAGWVGEYETESYLRVYEVSFTKADPDWRSVESYLRSCGFDTGDKAQTPELVWPPALTSKGDSVPLFAYADVVFKAGQNPLIDDHLFIHSCGDSADAQHTLFIDYYSEEGKSGYAIFNNCYPLSYVSLSNGTASSAILVQPEEALLEGWPPERQTTSSITLEDENQVTVQSDVPITIERLMRRGRIERDAIESTDILGFDATSLDAVRLYRKIGDYDDSLEVCRLELGRPEKTDSDYDDSKDKAPSLIMNPKSRAMRHYSEDRLRAMRRRVDR